MNESMIGDWMAVCVNERKISSNVNDFMSIFRLVLDKLFIKKDHSINATIVLNKLKEKKVDIVHLKSFLSELPPGEWNIKTFLQNNEKLTEIFGVSNEEINSICVTKVTEKDISEIKYKVLIDSMLEYSKFSSEFYDALKYNDSDGLSLARIKLLNEMMLVFKWIKQTSKKLYDNFEVKKLSQSNFKKFNIERLPIEFLILRILYISINLKEANDKKLNHFAALLGKERVSIMYQKIIDK